MKKEPHELTVEEVRGLLLAHIENLVKYWDTVKDISLSQKARLQGLAGSILTTLDGCSVDLPAFIVAPFPHESDKEFRKENGENWYPENHQSKINADIAGCLHAHFFRHHK